jgi:outer membrane protein OmpA-like peptidoglycan-associated protein
VKFILVLAVLFLWLSFLSVPLVCAEKEPTSESLYDNNDNPDDLNLMPKLPPSVKIDQLGYESSQSTENPLINLIEFNNILKNKSSLSDITSALNPGASRLNLPNKSLKIDVDNNSIILPPPPDSLTIAPGDILSSLGSQEINNTFKDKLNKIAIIEKYQPGHITKPDEELIVKTLQPKEGQEIKTGDSIFIWKDGRLYRKNNNGELTLVESSLNITPLDEVDGHKWVTLDDEGHAVIEVSLKVWATINFEYNSDEIMEESEEILAAFGRALNREALKNNHLIISGHTDNRGSLYFNLALSRNRAEAVARWLTEKANINPERLILAGYGDKLPIADNNSPEGQAKNRRVEFILLP